MACCIFKNCFNRPTPFSKVTFFNVPKDSRRQLWLERSGNEQVRNLPLTARRLVCEAHFEECHLRRQFHRTTLSRDAVPVSYERVFKYLKDDSTADQEGLSEQSNGVTYIENPGIDVQEVPTGSATELELVEEYLCDNEVDVYQLEYMENVEEPQEALHTEDNPTTKVFFETVATQTKHPEILSQINPLCKKRKLSETVKATTDQATNTEPTEVKHEPPPVEKVIRTANQSIQTDTPQESAQQSQKTEEEYFLLSLAEPLQRLPPEKRALAKVKMLTYLVQLGCGMENAQL